MTIFASNVFFAQEQPPNLYGLEFFNKSSRMAFFARFHFCFGPAIPGDRLRGFFIAMIVERKITMKAGSIWHCFEKQGHVGINYYALLFLCCYVQNPTKK
ncbi:MAG: hypothetical protein ACM3UW_01510 [Bacillota bacterium]